MAIDLKELVMECRVSILMDTDASDFRWPDVLMVQAVNGAVQDILQKRPILLFTDTNAYGSADDFVIPSNALANGGTHEIALPGKYREALLHATAARCFNGDANQQVNAQRMAYEQSRFTELMAQL